MNQWRKIVILSLKIGIGSSMAMYAAEMLNLDHAVSAGTITLLTLMNSKWETLKISACRFVTFTVTVLIAWMLFSHIHSEWIAYGMLLTILVFITETVKWRATISVNGVIAAHLVTNHDFSDIAVWNEFLLIVIGVVFAILLNLFYANAGHKNHIIRNMRVVEEKLQMLLGALAAYLSNKEMQYSVWEEICLLEKEIQKCIEEAYEYQSNTLHSHPEYYILYFEMRFHQCQILHNLHYEMKRIRTMPDEAKLVADYILYLAEFVTEFNDPKKQIIRLNEMIQNMKERSLPKTREEFEGRAILYHILMDVEEFLKCKMRFVQKLDSEKRKKYWKKNL